jgi:hypothetical protein
MICGQWTVRRKNFHCPQFQTIMAIPVMSTGGRLLGDCMRKIAFLLASVMIVTAPSMALAAKKKAKRHAPAAAAMSEPAPAASMMCCQDTVKMFQVGADAWKTPAGAPK